MVDGLRTWSKAWWPGLGCLLVLLALAGCGKPAQPKTAPEQSKAKATPDQPQAGGEQPRFQGSGDTFTRYYGPPNQIRMREMLKGAKIQEMPDKRIQFTDAELQIFDLKGQHEMAAEAPLCFLDRRQGTISSPGKIEAQFADGKFMIGGEGFLWHQTNADFIISNLVHTLIQPELLGAAATNAVSPRGEPLEILSHQFTYATNTGLAVWRENVRVLGATLTLTGGVLKAAFALDPRAREKTAGGAESPDSGVPLALKTDHRLQTITADENVNIDYAGIQAAGDTAVYTAETDQVRMTGNPTWRAQDREGRADELVVEGTNSVLHANGHAGLKIRGQSLGFSSFLPKPGATVTNQPTPREQVIEILSESYVLQTNKAGNKAVFRDKVHVSQRAGGEVEGTMTCSRLTAAFSKTNQLDGMIAEGGVIIQQKEKQSGDEWRFTSGDAVYGGSSGMLELSDSPAWQFGQREGHGDLIRVSSKPQQMVVRGKAWMRLPADELAQPRTLSSAVFSPGKTNTPAPAVTTPAPATGGTNQSFAEITSDVYTVTPDGAVFQNNVHMKHPQMDWTCNQVTVDFPDAGKATRHILAEGNVEFDMTDAKGQKLHGSGERGDYVFNVSNGATNELLVLRGRPARLKTERGTIEDSFITLDRVHTLITTARGGYVMRVKGEPMDTNAFRLPKNKIFGK